MFDLSKVTAASTEQTLLPDGKYTVVCSDAALKDTKAGTGQYIAATFTIKSGEQKGRQIFENFNVENPNPMAVKIGREGIKAFFENSTYTGDFRFETPNDAVVEMFGLIVGIETKVQESKNPEFGPSVRVKKYYKPTPAGTTSATPGNQNQKKAAPASDEIDW